MRNSGDMPHWVRNIENNACSRVNNGFSAHERVFLVFISRVAKQRGNYYQNNTRVSAETVRHESTYIIWFLTRHNESINDFENDELYTSSPCLTRSVFVLMTSRLLMTSQWPDNYDAITWIVISNSLDIDFIHGDIHDRSCKKLQNTWSANNRISRTLICFRDRVALGTLYTAVNTHFYSDTEVG